MHLLVFMLLIFVSGLAYAKPDLVDSKARFSLDGHVEMKRLNGLSDEYIKTESGSLNGVPYRIWYTDGSGVFAGTAGSNIDSPIPVNKDWTVECKKDSITDQKHCLMYMNDILVAVFPKGRVLVKVGRQFYPGSKVYIRVDRSVPKITSSNKDGYFTESESARLVSAISNADLVATRYMEWPYKTWKEVEWRPYGFKEALAYIRWAVERIQ